MFAIDIAAYAIMSNHYHLVLHINDSQATGWSDAEVIECWLMLFSGPPLIRRHLSGEELTESERTKITEVEALLTCMAYVDLSPLRAGLADTPESADFTSVQQRVSEASAPDSTASDAPSLQPLSASQPDIDNHVVPFALADYLELMDWTGPC